MRDEVAKLIYRLGEAREALRNAVCPGSAKAVEDAIAYIGQVQGLLRPEATPNDAAPTLEECIAAMSRNGYFGASDWAPAVASRSKNDVIRKTDAMLIGEGLIARERRAKGGA